MKKMLQLLLQAYGILRFVIVLFLGLGLSLLFGIKDDIIEYIIEKVKSIKDK